jgi:hypothetical protein
MNKAIHPHHYTYSCHPELDSGSLLNITSINDSPYTIPDSLVIPDSLAIPAPLSFWAKSQNPKAIMETTQNE